MIGVRVNALRFQAARQVAMSPLSVIIRLQVKALMKQAFEAGVNFFDNAEVR